MIRILLFLLLTLFSFFSLPTYSWSQEQQTVAEQTLTPERMQLHVASFEKAWETIRDKFYDPKILGLDWQAIHDELLPKLKAAKTENEARRVIRKMLSRLKVSHCAIISKKAYKEINDDAPKKNHRGTTGMQVRAVDGKAIVVKLEPNSTAKKAGVRAGWELLAVNDFDVPAKIAEADEKVEDSNPKKPVYLIRSAMSKMRGNVGDSISLKFRDGENEIVVKKFPLGVPRGRRQSFGNIPNIYIWFESKRIAPDVGYIGFNAFMDPMQVMKGFNDAMKSFKDTKGIIIDIRGNGGGSPGIVTGIMGWLAHSGEKKHFGTFIMRNHKFKAIVIPRATTYAGKIVVLIDEFSGSASEVLAGGLQDIGRAHIMGTPTTGAVLGSVIIKLPNGDGMQYPQSNYISEKSNKQVEGIGIIPDTRVKPDREVLLQGKDPVIQKALQWISKKPKI